MGSEIYKKLVKALAEMPSQLPQVEGYGYKYTPLPSIINSVRPVFAKHGLCVYQEVEVEGNNVIVRTIVADEEGNELRSPDLVMPVVDMAKCNRAQSIGATITYARRYSLSAFLGIATEEDVDAHSNGAPTANKITDKQLTYLRSMAAEDLLEEIAQKKFGKSVRELSQMEASTLITEMPKLLPSVPSDVVFVFTRLLGKKEKDAERYWKSYLAKYGKEAKIKLLEQCKKGQTEDVVEAIDGVIRGVLGNEK